MRHLISAAFLAFTLAACASEEPPANCKTRAYEEIGGPISLIDQNGEKRWYFLASHIARMFAQQHW